MKTFDIKLIESELKEMCEYFVKNAYGVKLDVPVKINNRLKRTLGRFIEKRGEAYKIEFSGILLTNGTEDQIMSVLKHECIHYALFKLGRKHRDGQEDFENELIKYNSHSTNTLHVAR
jgi:SprT-like protein